MKFFAVLALAPLALALVNERQAAPPNCAVGCYAQMATAPSSCAQTDMACACADPVLTQAMTECLMNLCAEGELAAAVAFSRQICAEAGVDVPDMTQPQSSGAASGSPSPTSSASASGASASASHNHSHSGSHDHSHSSSASASSSSSAAAASASSSSGAMPTGAVGGLVAAGLAAAALAF